MTMNNGIKRALCIGLTLIMMVALGAIFTSIAEAEETLIRIGHVDWPGVTVKSHVAKEILEAMGYNVQIDMYLLPVVFSGLDSGDLDFFLGMWWPTMRPNFTPYDEKGSIQKVGLNLDETVYKLAVPSYVWDGGVHSIADLNTYAHQFNRQIIGIEPGNEGNQIMIDAIADDIYDLAGWELVEGSTVAMMATLENAVRDEEWMVFLGWEPHWMNLAYDIAYLDDPEKIWGDEDQVVYTIARAGFESDSPNVYEFLRQFTVTPELQNEWIYEYGKMRRAPEDVAREWVANNLRLVDQWVYSLQTVDGERARDAIGRNY